MLLGAGCARGRPDAAGTADAPPALRDAWARPAAAGADGALYFVLANPGRDTLVLVGARADVAGATSLHESMRMGEGAGAMTHMAPLARGVVPPGDSAAFAPLGKHAMLERLRRPLAVGDSVPFALAVTRTGRVDTLRATAVVRAF
ncbi:hypothetical protein tb265_09140 [Gemmatimonadetes bacterium T265]|nr:hypothetical protein tb265_09140 [Gemmatimonadetes bacterium T265]